MTLFEHLFPRRTTLHVRPPDYVEERDGLFLQVWGEEGYWQVVDQEFRELLQAAAQPTSLASLLQQHPEWQSHRRSIHTQLAHLRKAGLLGTPPTAPPPPRIENVTINLTTGCNLNCRTCYVPQESRTPAKLEVDRLLPFLEDLRPCFSPAATLSLLGGEPFLHPQGVLEIGRWAKRHQLTCNVSTNGTVLPDGLLPPLADAGLKVQVSLDGATAETNDTIRGAGTFARATATVRRLVTSGIPTTLCMVCCRENLAEIPAYFRLARDWEAEQVRFIPLKQLGNSQAGAVTPAPQLEIVRAICRELDAQPAYRPMCQSDLYSIIRSMLRESSRRPSCGSGTQTLLVQADGTVYPCINTTLPGLKLGHLADGAAPVLARGAAFGQTLAVDSPSHPCHGCHVKRWCLAGCPGETLQQAGTLNRRHWNCQDLQHTISFVMWRLASESQTAPENAARTWL